MSGSFKYRLGCYLDLQLSSSLSKLLPRSETSRQLALEINKTQREFRWKLEFSSRCKMSFCHLLMKIEILFKKKDHEPDLWAHPSMTCGKKSIIWKLPEMKNSFRYPLYWGRIEFYAFLKFMARIAKLGGCCWYTVR